jgi:hypothetical protein
MAKPTIEVDKHGKTVTISTEATLIGSQINQWKLHDNDSVTFDFTMELDIDELAKIIGKDPGSDKPGWAKRMAEAVATEGLKAAIKEVVVEVGKSMLR